MIEFQTNLKNLILEEIINKTPIISDTLDIKVILKELKPESPEMNLAKIITSKYKLYRYVRPNGNSFYTCFLFRVFEYISSNQDKVLYDKFVNKIIESKDLIKKNGYDWEFLKEFYDIFYKEFDTCYQKACFSSNTGKRYLYGLFQSEARYNYLNYPINLYLNQKYFYCF